MALSPNDVGDAANLGIGAAFGEEGAHGDPSRGVVSAVQREDNPDDVRPEHAGADANRIVCMRSEPFSRNDL